MILIADSHDDVHTKCVMRELNALGQATVVLDTALFGKGTMMDQSETKSTTFTCPKSGVKLHADDIETVWLRRPGRFDLSGLVRDEHLDFVTREWRDAFWGWLDGLPARFVNPLVAQERATKMLQLRVANEVGLRTPATCMTNDAVAATAFIDRFDGRIVHKSLTQTKSMMLYTKPWDDDDHELLSELTMTPVLFQEHVFGPQDIRVTVIGEKLFAAIMTTPVGLVDSRLVTDLPYKRWTLPDDTAAKILDLMRRLNLLYGTIDLKVTDAGELVFLEVNPQGQFAFIEITTGLPLMNTFARFLSEPSCNSSPPPSALLGLAAW